MSEEKQASQAADRKSGGRRRRSRGRGGSAASEGRRVEASGQESAAAPPGRASGERDDRVQSDGSRDRRGRRGRRRNGDVEELGASSGIDVVDIPSDRRPRAGRLEPGLTLRDLLPFLRPPKSVVVLGVSTGSGHNRTASALTEALKQLDRNLVVRQHDVLDLLESESAPVRLRLEEMSQDPGLFGVPFDTRGEEEAPAEAPSGEFGGIFGEKFDHVAVDKRPDHIVCTHWLPLSRLKLLKDEGRLAATVSVVIPDPDLHGLWLGDAVAHYLAPHDGIRSRLEARGIEASRISVVGSPVSPAFSEPVDRAGVARSLGLRPQAATLLIRPGGIGSAERIAGVFQSLLGIGTPLNLLVVTGKNEALQERLSAIEVPESSTLEVFGFVQNMHELMGVSDLLVTRASPHTVAEAQAAGVPMLILRPGEGVEDRTADRLLRSGVAVKVYGEDDLLFAVRELLSNRRRLKDMQEAAQRRRRPDAARVAVDKIASLVR